MKRKSMSIHTVTIASENPDALATFWRELLDYVVLPNHTDSVQIGKADRSAPILLFAQREPGRDEAAPDRFHLDLRPVEHSAAVARALKLGATVIEERGKRSWARLRDPEGNAFCILQDQSEFDAYVAEHGFGTPSTLSTTEDGAND